MKKYISVFSLFLRSSIYKIIPLFVLTGAVQITLFINRFDTDIQWDGTPLGIEQMILNSRLDTVFVIAILILSAILAAVGCEFDSKTGYSLRRLQIKEKETLLCQSLFNILAIILFIVFEFAVSLVLFKIYFTKMSDINLTYPGFLSNQTMLLAFYRSDFLHNILPLQDYMRVIRNVIYVFGLGFSTAALPYFQRRRSICFEGIVMALFVAVTFFGYWDEIDYEIFYIVAALIVISILAYRVKLKGAAYEK